MRALSEDYKSKVLADFDAVIQELEAFLAEAKSFPEVGIYGFGQRDIPEEYEKHFYTRLRTRCLKVLSQIDSKDEKLQQAIDFVRDIEFGTYNLTNVLNYMRALRSDFDADILSLFPRITVQPPTKKGFRLSESNAIVIASIIAFIGSVLLLLLQLWINNLTQNETITPDVPAFTITASPGGSFGLTDTPPTQSNVEVTITATTTP